MLVFVDIFGDVGLGARSRFARLGRIAGGGEEGTVIAVVVNHAMRFRRAAGELRQQARKRVGRLCGRRVRVDHRMIRELREARAQIGGDAILKIDRVQSIDADQQRSEEHTSELQSRQYLVCRLLLEKKKKNKNQEL